MFVGRNVRYWRTYRGLTQDELADRIRLRRKRTTGSTVSRIECGLHDPRVSTLRSIARVLKVPLWVLIQEDAGVVPFVALYQELAPNQKKEIRRMCNWYLERRGH